MDTAYALAATNMSILTTTQSAIAADLDAFEEASWLTSSYLIAMSSIAPLSGRLCQLFSPRLCMFVSTVIVCLGCIITSISPSLAVFLLGRAVAGAGAAGIMIVATIIAVQLAGAKRRGLYIGLINSSLTVGVSLGAIIAGALEPKFGWVCRHYLYLLEFADEHKNISSHFPSLRNPFNQEVGDKLIIVTENPFRHPSSNKHDSRPLCIVRYSKEIPYKQ